MIGMNFIQIAFCLMASFIICFGSLINVFESKLPSILSQTFRYGKYAAQGSKSKLSIEVPKSWFRHFYVVAFLLYTYLLCLVTMVYIYGCNVPDYLLNFLNLVCGEDRITYSHKSKVFIAVLLMTVQVYRRFYETYRVSVFSESSKLNVTHYIVGMFHYPGTALAILSEAPFFADAPADIEEKPFTLLDLHSSDILAILLFLIAWKHQHACNKILGNLRRNKKGEVVSSEYKVPKGDWFEYLTAPHQTTEIILYTCIMWLLWNNITWFFVFAWVLVNQVETILLTHWWYMEKFDDFPKKRKALIPFVY